MNVDIERVIRDYLPKIVHMSLATSENGKPWASEVHFAYDGNLNLYFRSLTSRRHSQEIAKNPNVAGNIITQHKLNDEVVGVYFEGTAEKLTTDADREKAFVHFSNRLGVPESALGEAKREDGHQFYKIIVKNWYVFGRFGAPTGQKLKLTWNGGKHGTQG